MSWSGTPQDLYEQGAHVLEEVITFRDSCSDLVLAWDQAAVTARITRPQTNTLVQIGPAIHAGYPCDGDEAIALPQAMPAQLRLIELAQGARLLRLINVHPDQDEAWLDALQDRGVLDRVEGGELDFDLLGPARARAAYGRLLGGR